MKINKIKNGDKHTTKTPVKGSAKSKAKFDPARPYVAVPDVYCPPNEPGKQIPMVNICPVDRVTGQVQTEKRYVSFSRGKLAILFSHESVLEDLRAWYDEQVSKQVKK